MIQFSSFASFYFYFFFFFHSGRCLFTKGWTCVGLVSCDRHSFIRWFVLTIPLLLSINYDFFSLFVYTCKFVVFPDINCFSYFS